MALFNSNSKTTLPVLPIRNTVIFPALGVPLRVGRPRSVAAVEKAQADFRGRLLIVSQKEETSEAEAQPENLYRVGVLARIEKLKGDREEGYQVVVRATDRFRIEELEEKDGMLFGQGAVLPDELDADSETMGALLDSLKKLSREVLELIPGDTSSVTEMIDGIEDLVYLTHLASGNLDLPVSAKQELLEQVSVKGRALKLMEILHQRRDQLEVQNEIREKLTQRMGKTQRDHILREQLRTIREELGEGEGEKSEDYVEKIEKAGMPDNVRKIALDELKRLETIGNVSPEAHVIRNYIDLLIALPWSKSSHGEIDLAKARETLEADHTGLEKVKKRILEHLAVMKLQERAGERAVKEGDKRTDSSALHPEGKVRGSILCLVGPPGVGKTSLGQSIAHALGRKFIRASLGGVRDDAEIRGHRRTYIGAMPGRIIQSLKRAGENDPVFILDEIDKLSRSFSGDPASALLEVLDPEQNNAFLDHYLDVPFDLSKVFFIATANSLETIPAPLLDRMEVIELTGYTVAEKLHIARNHLIPKQLDEHGIPEGRLEISDEALVSLVTHYTREAGVRDLQRKIAAVCRGMSERVLALGADEPQARVRVELSDLDEILGPERFQQEVAETVAPAGVVTGLAWTPMGGEILFIEATEMPGNGKLTVTGQLGEVMKESVQIALSLVRSRIPVVAHGFDFEKRDLHIHVPAGAIPKDGPSAGVTMLTALASLLTGRTVDPRLAMTGEITLRGAVMPVGGIKEKVIAAHRAGIRRVILPRKNQKDLREIPQEIRDQVQIEWVDRVEEVISKALGIDVEATGSGFPASTPPQPTPPVLA